MFDFHLTMRRKIALFASTAILAVQPAWADPASPATEEELYSQAATQRVAEDTVLVADGGPVEKEGSGFGGGEGIAWPKFELSNADDTIIGTLALGYTLANSSFDAPVAGSPQKIKASLLKVGLKASAPFNGAGKNDVIDFKHLGNDAKATLSITYFSTAYNEGGAKRNAVNKALGQCFRDAIDPYIETLPLEERSAARSDANAMIAAYESKLAASSNAVGRDVLDFELNNQNPKFRPRAIEACGGDIGEIYLLQTYGRKALGIETYSAIARDFLNTGNVFFLGTEGTVVNGKHDILDRANFAVDTIDRVALDAVIYGGYISGNGNWSAKLSAGYARGYEAKDEVEFCIPAATGLGQQCLKAEDGRPAKDTTAYVKAEGRFTLFRDKAGVRRIAIAPEVSYDIDDDDFLIDVPLFFQRTDGDGLSGGMRASYATEKKDFSFRFFVGIPFSTWF